MGEDLSGENKGTPNELWELLKELSKKSGISEIVINGEDKIFVERSGVFYQLNKKVGLDDIERFIRDVAAYNKVDYRKSYLFNGTIPNGGRVNIVFPPVAVGWPAISIRRYVAKLKTFDSAPDLFGLNPAWIYFLRTIVKAKTNIIVSGGTGSGKTTFMNLLLQEIPIEERVITMEDTLELSITLPNLVRLELNPLRMQGSKTNIEFRDLIKNALRMRPDRIIIGECRGEEFFDLLVAMNTGHDGSMTTLHSNSSKECLRRMEMMFLFSGHDVPIKAVREQISQSVDFIIQLGRTKKGERVVKEILEIGNMEGDVILTNRLGLFEDGSLRRTGISPLIMDQLVPFGLDADYFSRDF